MANLLVLTEHNLSDKNETHKHTHLIKNIYTPAHPLTHTYILIYCTTNIYEYVKKCIKIYINVYIYIYMYM